MASKRTNRRHFGPLARKEAPPPDDPYIRLLIGVVKQAKKDMKTEAHRQEAHRFIQQLKDEYGR